MEASIAFLPDAQAVEKKSTDAISQAAAFAVTTHEQEVAGVELIRVIKGLKKEVEDTFDDAIEKAHKAHKAMLAAKKKHYDPLDAAEKSVRGKIVAYQDEQEKLRKAEEARLAEEARKEQQKRIDAAAKKVNALLAKSDNLADQIADLEIELGDDDITDEEKAAIEHRLNLLRIQQENIERGIQQKTAEAEQARYVAPTPAMPAPAPKVQGASSKVVKKARVDNPMLLIKAVAAGTVAPGVITFDMAALDKLINAGAIIPGVGYTENRSLTVR